MHASLSFLKYCLQQLEISKQQQNENEHSWNPRVALHRVQKKAVKNGRM